MQSLDFKRITPNSLHLCTIGIKQEIYRKRVRISSKTLEKANKSNKCIFLPFCLEITLTVVKVLVTSIMRGKTPTFGLFYLIPYIYARLV
jgi:hypothetical protein